MPTAQSHENSANNDTEETSLHSSSSRSISVSRSLNIRLNAEMPIAAPTTGLRSRPIARRTWSQGMSPPRQPQPQQPPRLPSPRHPPASIHEVGGPSTPIVGIPVGRLPPESWEQDYLSVERVRQLHDQGFEREMRPYHPQNLMDQVSGMASSSDSSTDESGYVTAKPPCPRAAYVTGPDPTRTIDLNVPDHLHEHVLGKRPMWLSAESSVSAPMRLERPKARTRENDRKRTHLTKKVTFKNLEIGEPSTKAPLVVTPRESTKEYVQLYEYFDWKDKVNESLGWLTCRGTDMKARLDFHTDLATDMSGHMNELEQDIMQSQERTTTAIRYARTARIHSRVAIVVALVVSIVSMIIQLYR
ncbi:hypothetical protein L1987_54700 [Smallanthus sonchifolius]|uniref:Uncharacterized protein n=1 Tax=Smallanthus sonchifolius TaxID=185202 RepID=A0ACB9E8I9_9ASTR|nr:hypothetical protein L1987_54700 [Smallanthus sonchifolius]